MSCNKESDPIDSTLATTHVGNVTEIEVGLPRYDSNKELSVHTCYVALESTYQLPKRLTLEQIEKEVRTIP